MATKNAKKFYYVLVFTSEGPKYVTGTGDHHTAYWDKLGKPETFSKGYAEDMVLGLTLNGYTSVLVCHPYEIDHQPYMYENGTFVFKESENEE